MKWLNQIHCMVDIETLDTASTAVILSIGACTFDLKGLGVMQQFYVNVDPADAKAHGCTISKDTLEFWSKQSKEVRAAFKAPAPVPLKEALEGFFQFYKDSKAQTVWCHGATFDVPVIGHAADKVGLTAPYKYWDVMCNRTVLTMLDSKLPKGRVDHHNALGDAVAQAQYIISLFDKDPF